jgi:hypothetical protein
LNIGNINKNGTVFHPDADADADDDASEKYNKMLISVTAHVIKSLGKSSKLSFLRV